MNREAFVPPTSTSQLSNAASGISAIKYADVKYTCSNCATSFSLSKGDPVRCKECGGRVLYKCRTKRMGKYHIYLNDYFSCLMIF